jgi:hypothetical protein
LTITICPWRGDPNVTRQQRRARAQFKQRNQDLTKGMPAEKPGCGRYHAPLFDSPLIGRSLPAPYVACYGNLARCC